MCFKGEPFKDIDAFNNALYWELRRLDQYSKNSFKLWVKDTTDYKTFGCWDLIVRYENKNHEEYGEGIIYLLGKFDKHKDDPNLHAYCATLARVFSLISFCGYSLKLVDTEEAIHDDLWESLTSVTTSTGKSCLIINDVHREEMFIVANQILAGNHAIGKLILANCKVELTPNALASCLSTGIVFSNCTLSNDIIKSLFHCKFLGVLKLFNCTFSAGTFVKSLRDKLLRPEISCIYKIDFTGSALQSEERKQLWLLGHLFGVFMFGIENDQSILALEGCKYHGYEDGWYKNLRASLPEDDALEDIGCAKKTEKNDFEDIDEYFRNNDAIEVMEDFENLGEP